MIIVGNIYAGLNSGGSSTVNTRNGISGDGSVGNPVVLGGNPLVADTDLDLSGFSFDIFEISGGITFQQTNSRDNWNVAQSDGTDMATIGVTNVAGVFAAGIGLVKQLTGLVKQVACNNTANSGIEVSDTVDNIGLQGDLLFPVNGNPNQYAQYGNIGSGVTGAESGTHVTSGKVRLGGTLLVGTLIDTGNFSYQLKTTDLNGLVTTFQQLFTGVQSWKVVNGISNAGITLGDPGAIALVKMSIDDGGNNKSIQMGEGDIGIPVQDDTGIGLIGDALFPESDPRQYAQYGNLVTPQNFALPLGSGNRTALTYAVTGGDACIQVNCALSTSVAAGAGTSVTLAYTDINGNAASKILCLDGGVTGNFPANTITIEAQNGTNVTISATAVGGEVYRVVGAIQRFF